jgi:adenine deaminase
VNRILRPSAVLLSVVSLLGSGLSVRAAQKIDTTQKVEIQFSEETKIHQDLVQVALGLSPADMIVKNANILDVFTEQWNPGQDIVIKSKHIAWVGPTGTWTGKCDNVMDAAGAYVVPGFGESHKHLESTNLTPEYEGALVMPFGVTWTTEGSHEFSNVNGVHNVEYWLMARQKGSVLKIFPALGSATPPSGYEMGNGYYGYNEIKGFIDKNRWVGGLDEVMDWTALKDPKDPGYQRLWEDIQATWDARGVVEGHGSGLFSMDEINGFAAAGLSSDHEAKQTEEAWLKLEHGVFLELKQNNITNIVPYLVQQGLKDWSNTSVTTDDRDAATTLKLGAEDYNIRLAINAGAPVEAAYCMGSYNIARHWHFEHLVGSIAPGRFADLVFLKGDPKLVAVDKVIADGKLAASDGKYLLPIPKIDYPAWATKTMNVGRELTAKDFAIKAPPGGKPEANAAILTLFYFEPNFMTDTLPVKDGFVQRDDSKMITKVALIDRYHGIADLGKMFWKNVGPKTPNSALSCSIAHDLHDIWVTGSSDEAMALAANTVADMGGGWVLVNNGQVVAKVRLEVGGLMSCRPAQEVGADLEHLWAEGDKMEWFGQPGIPKRMIAGFLTCTPWHWVLVAPTDKIPSGLVDVTTGHVHDVVW